MSRKNPRIPPWKSSIPYFRHDAQAFKDAHRPHWTAIQLRNTIETIWNGDPVTCNYYAACVGQRTLPGLPPGRDIIPANPYNQQDSAHALATGTLPPRRDAAGNPILPVPAAPQIPLPRPRNNYPYDFWPQEPWDPDPIDETADMTFEELNSKSYVFLATLPHQWPERDESDMRAMRWLGSGSYGCAGLWCQIDESNRIIKRFVIKESKMKKDYWRDPILWRDQLPREIRIHQLIDSNRADAIDDHDTLAEHHGYRLMMRQHRYRLYLTYYEGGDLYAALRGMPDAELKFLYTSPHKQRAKSPVNYHWDFNFNCYRDDDNDSLPRVVPERLICEIIDSLAKACQMLHFRQVDSEDAAEGTHRITHLDIKADNIFMQPSPEPDAFPKFVLSDYGLGFFAHDRNENMDDSSDNTAAPGLRAPPDNPDEYVFTFSTFDYRYAPEHHEQVQRMHPRPLGEKTDVWQIGAVFFWLLTNGFGRSIRGPKALYRGKLVYISNDVDIGKVGRTSGTDQFCDDTYPTLIRYNNKLRNLCARCLNWNPDHRPGLAEVRETTRAVLEANPRMRDDRDLAMLNVRRDDEARIGAILVGQEVEEL